VTDVIRYEWLRLLTLRSTWLLAVASWTGVGLLTFGLVHRGRGVVGPVEVQQILTGGSLTAPLPFAAVIMAVLGVLTHAHESRHGMLASALVALPRRLSVYAVRAVITALFALFVGVVSVVVAWGVGYALLGPRAHWLTVPDPVTVRVVGGYLALVVAAALAGLAVGGLVRRWPFALVLTLALPIVAEPLLTRLLAMDMMAPVRGIGRHLPFQGGRQMLTDGQVYTPMDRLAWPVEPWLGGVTLGAYVLALLVVCAVLFVHRDV
jgi:ABC-2 type transport system permease protein